VKRFIPSEFSGNMENKTNVATISMFADRVTVADYAKEKAAANPTFSYTILSTGPFYDWVCLQFDSWGDIGSHDRQIVYQQWVHWISS
jgi:hypothetical protein